MKSKGLDDKKIQPKNEPIKSDSNPKKSPKNPLSWKDSKSLVKTRIKQIEELKNIRVNLKNDIHNIVTQVEGINHKMNDISSVIENFKLSVVETNEKIDKLNQTRNDIKKLLEKISSIDSDYEILESFGQY